MVDFQSKYALHAAGPAHISGVPFPCIGVELEATRHAFLESHEESVAHTLGAYIGQRVDDEF